MEFESGPDRLCSPPSLHSSWYGGTLAGIKRAEREVGQTLASGGDVEAEMSYTPTYPQYLHGRHGTTLLIRRFSRKALITFRQVRHSVSLSVHLSFRPSVRAHVSARPPLAGFK
jgi:hypothetical protein